MKAEELLNACRTEYRFAVKENHGRYTVTQTVTYSDASGNTIGTPQTLTIFDSVLTGADLRSLYVCYIPALRTAGDMYRTQEKVVIENRQDIPVDVYLIRQGSQDTPLAVSIIESAPSTVAATQIHTNLSVDDKTDIGSIERNGSSITAATAKSAFGFQKMGEAAKADAARLYTVKVTVKPVDSGKINYLNRNGNEVRRENNEQMEEITGQSRNVTGHGHWNSGTGKHTGGYSTVSFSDEYTDEVSI